MAHLPPEILSRSHRSAAPTYIEFKRQAQARIYEQIKDMTHEEEIEFFRRGTENGPFAELIKRLSAKEEARKN